MHGRYCHGLRRLNDNSSASAGAKYSPVPSVLDNDNDHGGPLFLTQSTPLSPGSSSCLLGFTQKLPPNN